MLLGPSFLGGVFTRSSQERQVIDQTQFTSNEVSLMACKIFKASTLLETLHSFRLCNAPFLYASGGERFAMLVTKASCS